MTPQPNKSLDANRGSVFRMKLCNSQLALPRGRVNSNVGFHPMRTRTLLTSIGILLLVASAKAATGGRLCFTRGDYVFIQESNGRITRLVKGYEPNISP